jgi:REP element-mobilizing transposase RayT
MLIERRSRKANRLKGFNYSQAGKYFVTICVKDRESCFGQIQNGVMSLNNLGKIVKQVWVNLPRHYPYIVLDEYVVMPNHFHGIVIIQYPDHVGAGFKPAPTLLIKKYSLSEIIRGFKTFSSRQINQSINDSIFRWQRSFYDRVIRNERELNRIRDYIKNNPLNWQNDRNNFK